MDDNAKSRYRSRRMGFVFQTYNLLPVLTAVENVELPLLVARVPAKEARRRALALMTAVELDGWADHKPAQLSAGQQQRVAIARALVNDPAIVWADEPTGNLDSETSVQIMDLLVRLNREQRQTLVVGDTLSYIFLEDVYARLDAIDELVSNTFNGQLISFSETNFTQIRADLGTAGSPIDGIAPALLKIMPVRNVAGNKGNQQISVMGLNATLESGFGSLTTVDGRTVDTNDLRLSITTRNLALLVQTVKADDIASALQVGRDATDLFLVMGAFGILAGVLLIVNIFVMLAEERKPELGVARAVGFLRSDLLTTFALEGTFYAVVAAALGALAGLGL